MTNEIVQTGLFCPAYRWWGQERAPPGDIPLRYPGHTIQPLHCGAPGVIVTVLS